jgi:hypothetical protein
VVIINNAQVFIYDTKSLIYPRQYKSQNKLELIASLGFLEIFLTSVLKD